MRLPSILLVSAFCPLLTSADLVLVENRTPRAEIVISAWEGDFIRKGFREALSTFEASVLRLYVQGCSYQEIADELGRHAKSVDNALQRIKRKMEAQVDRCRLC